MDATRLWGRLLDRPHRPTARIRATVPGRPHDVAAPGEGTVVVAASEGVYALRADP
ncbi:hypothetical protein [Nocardiopsis dassonvillei]|uniref:hypothetical protein n=1 Tax=Nocardiopsis dassonvillei TaxID=2014 RepID=UPI00363DF09C